MIYLHRRGKWRQKRNRTHSNSDRLEDNRPYLQQKAELEAEEKLELESEASELNYELIGANDVQEMPG